MGALYRIEEKGGVFGKFAIFFLLPSREIEEERGGHRRRLAGSPGPRWRTGGGKRGARRR